MSIQFSFLDQELKINTKFLYLPIKIITISDNSIRDDFKKKYQYNYASFIKI